MAIVSPDVGGVARASNRLVPTRHRRQTPRKAGVSEVTHIIGDVEGANASWSTISSIAAAHCATPPNPARQGRENRFPPTSPRRVSSKWLGSSARRACRRKLVTNLIDPDARKTLSKKIRTMSVAQLMGDAIWRIANEESVSHSSNRSLSYAWGAIARDHPHGA